MRLKSLGTDHPDTAISYINLALNSDAQGRLLDEAIRSWGGKPWTASRKADPPEARLVWSGP